MPGPDEGQQISLTEQADESGGTAAFERSYPVDARAAITTRRGVAFVDVLCAVSTGKAGCACAPEVVHQLGAGAPVGARSCQTLVHVVLAQRPDEPGWTLALEVVRSVDAAAVVEAGVDGTFVAVDLASLAHESRRTNALETVDCVQARSTLSPQHQHSASYLYISTSHHVNVLTVSVIQYCMFIFVISCFLFSTVITVFIHARLLRILNKIKSQTLHQYRYH